MSARGARDTVTVDPIPPIRVAVWAVIVRGGDILLVEFDDPQAHPRHHFNLPGGGVEPGELLTDTIRREVYEETGAQVEVGELLLVWDHVPPHPGPTARPHVRAVFRCALIPGSEPTRPAAPDTFQTGVQWVALTSLDSIPLIPPIGTAIRDALAHPSARNPYMADHADY